MKPRRLLIEIDTEVSERSIQTLIAMLHNITIVSSVIELPVEEEVTDE